MTCRTVKVGDVTAIVCSRGQKPKPCFYCREPSSFLCDAFVGGEAMPADAVATVKPKLPSLTCDRPLCKKCAKTVGPDLHRCRLHASVST